MVACTLPFERVSELLEYEAPVIAFPVPLIVTAVTAILPTAVLLDTTTAERLVTFADEA